MVMMVVVVTMPVAWTVPMVVVAGVVATLPLHLHLHRAGARGSSALVVVQLVVVVSVMPAATPLRWLHRRR